MDRRHFFQSSALVTTGAVVGCAMPGVAQQSVKTPFPVAAVTIPIVGSDAQFPVRRIYCIGRNYRAHAIEMGSNPDREPPFFFQKPTDSIQFVKTGTVADHPYPTLTKNYHYEAELVAAIGIGGKNISVEKALDHVWGYSLGLDMTRRDLQRAMGDEKKPWEIGKSFDKSAPIGAIHPVAQIGHFQKGAIWLKVNGEFATEEYMIPMATTEGTLVASYNRGIKVLNLSGGVKCTVVADAMQRAPVFVFEDARAGRKFVSWIIDNFSKIKEQAETTSSIAKLKEIDHYISNKFVFLRFNYSTGDAAGQNMVGRATFAACSWIIDVYEKEQIKHFYLESNFATDKKASQVNIMRTRGKRVTAECTVPRQVLIEHMRVEPESLTYHSGVANVGSFLSGANNNGAHSANGITAMFIATGQDVSRRFRTPDPPRHS